MHLPCADWAQRNKTATPKPLFKTTRIALNKKFSADFLAAGTPDKHKNFALNFYLASDRPEHILRGRFEGRERPFALHKIRRGVAVLYLTEYRFSVFYGGGRLALRYCVKQYGDEFKLIVFKTQQTDNRNF